MFFTDVEVPEENLLGEQNNGWSVSQGSLRHERGMLWIMNVAKMERTLRGLSACRRRPDGRGGTLGDDPRLAEAIGQVATDTVSGTRCLGYRGFAKASRGEMPPEHMVLKLFRARPNSSPASWRGGTGSRRPRSRGPGCEPLHRMGRRPLRSLHGVTRAPWGLLDGAWPVQYLRSFADTIAGGTSEIQRNIVAERVLGLPRS